MNTNILISLDKRRKKKDGSYPIVLRLGHNERTTAIPIGISVLEKDWDSKNRAIKKSCTKLGSVTRLNNLIQKKKSDAMDIIVKLNEDGVLNSLKVSDLKNKIVNTSSETSFFTYTEKLITDLKKSKQAWHSKVLQRLNSST